MNPIRNDIRDDIRGGDAATPCPVCDTPFIRTRRQRYCSPACRQAAWRARHPASPPPTPAVAPRPRREHTVYVCADCEQRYFAQQWCTDCNRPCHRIDFGGTCPHCLLTELSSVS